MRCYPRRLLRLAARPDTHFVAVSEAIKNAAIAYGIPPRKIATNYIGIDVAKFAPGPTPVSARRPRVVFVGRLVEKKGCEYLLRAMRIVRRRVPEAELTIVGQGPERAGLETLSRELRLNVRFTGALPAGRVKAELDGARAFCLPSIRAANGDAEGFGLVLLEAQAAGVPVVSSAFGGAEEGMLHGKTGYRVGEKDVDGLAAALAELLLDADKAERMGNAARQFVSSRFDIGTCTEALESRYNHLTGIEQNEPADHIRYVP
jgi:glycosyltransferase involved in cell wall biosynthesis